MHPCTRKLYGCTTVSIRSVVFLFHSSENNSVCPISSLTMMPKLHSNTVICTVYIP